MAEKALLFIDMDGVLVDFYGGVRARYPKFDYYKREQQKEITNKLSAEKDFFIHLKPIPGALAAFKILSESFDVYILSTPLWEGPHSWSGKKIWVENHLRDYAYKRLILSHNKGLFSGRALIDDHIRNGVENFQGEHIHFGTEKFPNWEVVLEYLID